MFECGSEDMGSIPINYLFCYIKKSKIYFCLNSSVVEHWTENPRVSGSKPFLSAKYFWDIVKWQDTRF